MKAERLKERLTVLQPVRVTGKSGGEQVTWQEVKTICAELKKQSGQLHDEVAEHFNDYRAEFNIRIAHRLDDKWRVQHHGGYLYTICNQLPNRDRGMITLLCEKVNE